MFTKKLIAIAASAGLALTLAACGGTPATPGTTPGAGGGAAAGGGIKIGIKFDQPGLGLREGAEYTGFDVEVAKYVAKELGHTEGDIDWIESPSAQRETLIETGQVDLIFATYSITDKRAERVSFGGPYLIAGQGLLVRADDDSITGPETLAGKKLCSVTGSTPAQKIKDQYPDVELQELGTYSECLPALLNGTLDAMTTDDTILAGFAAQEQYAGKLKLVGEPFTTEKYGVGLKKGDTELCGKVNDAIKKMVDDGSWQAAVDKTLGPAKYVPGPGNPPTPDACS